MKRITTYCKYVKYLNNKNINDIQLFNIFVQEFSGFFKPEMNCTLMGIRIFFIRKKINTLQMLSDKLFLLKGYIIMVKKGAVIFSFVFGKNEDSFENPCIFF